MPVQKIVSKAEFEKTITENNMAVVHFYAEWATQCGPMNLILEEMANQTEFKKVHFAKIEAEVVPEISVQYKIAAVPTFVVFKDGSAVDVVNGANPAELTKTINKHAGTNAVPPSDVINSGTQTLEERLKALIKLADVMVFMKGNPGNPRCGFSRTLIGILNKTDINYETFDILNDEDVRQGLKKFSNWPTYPQVYVKGELIGGLDIIQELESNGELLSTLNPNFDETLKDSVPTGDWPDNVIIFFLLKK